jgi:cell shape-determining protein MreC
MFSSLSRRRVAILLVLTCLLLITLDRRGNPVINSMRNVFSSVLRPFETAADAVSRPIADAVDAMAGYDDLKRENEQLRDQLESQKGVEAKSMVAVLELQELQELNRLLSTSNLPAVTARVVGEAPSNFQNTIEINVGANRGVGVGMPVTNGAGLIGRITKVYSDRAVVVLITDPNYNVQTEVLSPLETPGSVVTTTTDPELTPSGISPSDLTSSTTSTMTTTTLPDLSSTTTVAGGTPVGPDTSNATGTTTATTVAVTTTVKAAEVIRETGVLTGQGAGRPLLFRFIDDSAALKSVKVGAQVVTAGGAQSLAPQGLPIGTITLIDRQSGSRAPIVEVTPNASLAQLGFLSVVLYVPNPKAN